MITRQDVADLKPGDVVRLAGHPGFEGATVEGPLYLHHFGELRVGGYTVRYPDGEPNRTYRAQMFLTLVSRAPEPIYSNHPRTRPVHGDVVRQPDPRASRAHNLTWYYDGEQWRSMQSGGPIIGGMPKDVVLLVDGDTGDVVR